LSTVVIPTNSAPHAPPPDFTQEKIRDYLSDLEVVLRRVDSGRTYYQILGVDRTDDQGTLRSSYQRTLDLFYPGNAIGSAVPADVASRVERAFTKLSQAFGVLASVTRRKEYDSALVSVARKRTARAVATDQYSTPKPEPSEPIASTEPETESRKKFTKSYGP